jgi:hypothetical protein
MIRALRLSLVVLVTISACGDKDGDSGAAADATDGADGADGSTDGVDGSTDGADGGSTDGGGDGADGGDGSSALTVAEGHWTITDGSIIYDNCQADGDLPASEGDGFVHASAGADAFSWTFDATGDVASCTFSDERNYACDRMSGREDIDDFDITITSTIDISGVYIDESSSTGEWVISIDCDGGDCWLAELESDVDFPCDVRVAVQAAAD